MNISEVVNLVTLVEKIKQKNLTEILLIIVAILMLYIFKEVRKTARKEKYLRRSRRH